MIPVVYKLDNYNLLYLCKARRDIIFLFYKYYTVMANVGAKHSS